MKHKYLSAYIVKQDGLSIAPTAGQLEDIAFSAVAMLPPGESSPYSDLRSDTLYFIRSDLPARFSFPDGLSFVVLRFNDEMPPEAFRTGARLIIVAENAAVFTQFYERCRQVLSIDAQMSHALLHLTKMVSKNRSFKEIAKYIAQVYSSTVSIVDNAYSVLAYADPADSPPEKLNNEYKRGWLDLSAVKILNQIDFLTPRIKLPEWKYYNIPQNADPSENVGYKRNNYCVIYINGNAAAAISVFDDFDIDEYKLKYMEAISYILSTYMQKQEFYQLNRGAYFNHLMSIIIGGLNFDPDVMRNRLAVSGYRLEEYKYVIAVERTESTGEAAHLDSLGLYLKNLLPNSIYIILRNKLVYLMSVKQLRSPEEFLGTEKFLRSVGVRAGVSNAFKRLEDVRIFLDEANEALEMGRQTTPERSIYLFEDYAELSVAKNLIQSGGRRPEMYLYPPLMELIFYDKANGSSLVETLREYLRDPKNPKAVYEKLYIHKNTLYYRLDKIKQIMGVNYEAADVQMKINLTFAMLEYKKRCCGGTEFMQFD